MAQKNRNIQIAVHPLFYKKLETAKQNYSKKFNLSKNISMPKFTECLSKANYNFNLKDISNIDINKIKLSRRGFNATKKRK